MANDINFSERIIKRIDGLSFDEKIVLLKNMILMLFLLSPQQASREYR